MEKKLAECLLRRKELQEKVDQLSRINVDGLFVTKVRRVKVTDSIDDLTLKVPVLSASQVTAEYNYYAKALRNIDGLIQQCNWTTEVAEANQWFKDYDAPAKEEE